LTTSYLRFSNNLNSGPGRLNLMRRDERGLRRSRLRLAVFALVALLLLLEASGCYLAGRQKPAALIDPGPPGAQENRMRILRNKNASLEKKIAALAPKGPYVVVDTANNRVFFRREQETLREMLASCGSGNVLEDPAAGKKWVFDTPRGDFKVQSKVTNPIWIKPDWAFLEEGEPIPERSADRAEAGMMGDYALGLGRGYFIHGTMYKRMLGRNVSHGCIRLGDEDLEFLYETAGLGTRVIIF